jgi:hypothetical protein
MTDFEIAEPLDLTGRTLHRGRDKARPMPAHALRCRAA